MADMQFFEQALEAIVEFRFRNIQQFQNRPDILLHAQLAEDGSLLRQIGKALTCPAVHRQVSQPGVVDMDFPAIGGGETDDHVETGRLARAIGSEQADHLTTLDLE